MMLRDDAKVNSTVTAKRATLYHRNEFMGNIVKVEVRDLTIQTGEYAQYGDAVAVSFTRKGRRRPECFVEGFQPSVLAVEGWGHPEPLSAWEPVSENEKVGIQKGRYRFCDPRWQGDFNKWAAEALAHAKVIGDFRGHDTQAH